MQNAKLPRKLKKLLLSLCLFLYLVSPTPTFAFVVINELMPNPTSGDDWIELYKSDPEEIDISGWQIEDKTSIVKTFPDGTKIASNSSFMQVFVSNRLNKDNDLIKLKDKNSNVVDEKSYSQDPGTGVSIGRYPDGSDNWGVLTSSSPNTANSSLVPTPTLSPTATPTVTAIPTPIPTSSPKNTPEPTSTPKPQSTPTKYISPTSKITSIPTSPDDNSEGSVLGEISQVTTTPMEEKTTEAATKNYLPVFQILLGSGLLFILSAVMLSIRQSKTNKKT